MSIKKCAFNLLSMGSFLAWKNITDHSTRERERQKRACCRVSRATDWCITAPQMEWGRVRKRNTSMLCGIWLLVKMIAVQKVGSFEEVSLHPRGDGGWEERKRPTCYLWNMILSSSSSLSVLSTGSCYRSHFSPSFWWSGACTLLL